jgi:hypothetical protein
VYLQKNVKFQAVAGSQVSIGARHNLRPSGRLLRKRQGKDDAIIAKIHFYKVIYLLYQRRVCLNMRYQK